MSGFEVVGVVLGVLPLAIEAIKTYYTILSSAKSAQSDLNWLRQDLETEHIRLQNTCEILLTEIAPLSKVDGLIKDPFGPDWVKYNDKLRQRLWSSWDTFQTQVELLSSAAVELEKKLCFDKNGVIRLNNSKKVLGELKQNADFTLRKRDYEALLQKIKSSNTVLHHLARQDIVLESSRKHRSQARVVKLLRGLSRSIFEALHSAVTCKCMEGHSIGFELTHRTAVLVSDDEENEVAKAFRFEVVFDTSLVWGHPNVIRNRHE
ncbi:hypothetical protein KJ359_008961 [Pestalotiopsis sp. 9143b]|nr:hypothetical protein KJ359_008961 [Pestalotiopsis sp. 9143b]